MELLLYPAVFVCGFAALIYQVLWERSLALMLGAGAYAVTAVVTVFMVGLALGSAAGGALADRLRRPLAVAAALECSIGLYALALTRLWRPSLLCILLPLPATLCMGASWPLVCVAFPGRRSSPGARTAVLYGLNTLGAALGCFSAGFFLIRSVGTTRANAAAAGLSLLGAGLLGLASLGCSVPSGRPEPARALEYPARALKVVRAVVAVNGLCCMAYEVLWFRALRFVIGSTVYSFCVMLTALLAGLGLGALVTPWLLRRRRESALTWLAAAQTALGVCTLWSVRAFALAWTAAGAVLGVLARWMTLSPQSWALGRATNFGVAFMVLLVPCLCLGCLFPLANEILVRDERRPGRDFGAVYFLSLAGCAVGPALVTFLLIPVAGLNVALLLFAALDLLMGAGLILLAGGGARAMGAVTAAAVFSLWLLPDGFIVQRPSPSLLYERDGVLATIRVFVQGGVKFLATDNFYVQGSDPTDAAVDPRRLGLMPYLLHPRRRLGRVLQIGLGTGINLGALARAPVDSIDVAEIVPELVDADRYFAGENGGVLSDPRVHVFFEDGRRFVAEAHSRYDLIVGDLLFPDHAGTGGLYSVEHFRNCRRALDAGGLMVQWLPLHQVSVDGLKSVMASFAQAFPHVSLWWGTLSDRLPVVALVGSEAPLEPDEASLRAKYAALRFEPRQVLWDTPECLLGDFIASDGAFRAMAAGVPANTDDRPYVEFQTPRTNAFEWDRRAIAEKLRVLASAMETADPRRGVALSRRAHQLAMEGLALAVAGDGAKAAVQAGAAARLAPGCGELEAVRSEVERLSAVAPGSSRATAASSHRADAP